MIAPTLSTKWRMVTLDDVAAPVHNAIVDGPFGSNLKLDDYVPEGVPVLQGKNITNDSFRWFGVRFITSRKAEELKRSSVRIGDILIVKIGSIGYSAILDDLKGYDQAIIPANLAKVTPNLSKVDLRYLYRWLTSTAAKHHLVRVASKTAQPALSLGKIKALPVPLPPLPEQRRIAEILDRADALRAKRRVALTYLDTLTESIFLDMFGDPATNPMGWPRPSLLTLLETAEVFVDGDWVKSKDQDPEGDVRLIQLADIGDGVYLDKSSRFLTSDTAYRLRCTPLQVGDILVARMPGPLGRACLFPGDAREAVTVVDICIIRPGPDGPHPTWLMCCINTIGFRSLIAREATGTTRSRISRRNLSRLPIIAPPLALQQEFARRLEAVTDLRANNTSAEAECGSLFASLQHRVFQGEM